MTVYQKLILTIPQILFLKTHLILLIQKANHSGNNIFCSKDINCWMSSFCLYFCMMAWSFQIDLLFGDLKMFFWIKFATKNSKPSFFALQNMGLHSCHFLVKIAVTTTFTSCKLIFFHSCLRKPKNVKWSKKHAKIFFFGQQLNFFSKKKHLSYKMPQYNQKINHPKKLSSDACLAPQWNNFKFSTMNVKQPKVQDAPTITTIKREFPCAYFFKKNSRKKKNWNRAKIEP